MNNFSVNNSLVKSKLKTGLLHLVILAFSILICSLIGCSSSKNDAHSTASSTENNKELTPVTLNEVAHSIFYAPQYTAIELGYFEEEGISLTLDTGFGADKTMTALISGNADIGFMGSEASIIRIKKVMMILLSILPSLHNGLETFLSAENNMIVFLGHN